MARVVVTYYAMACAEAWLLKSGSAGRLGAWRPSRWPGAAWHGSGIAEPCMSTLKKQQAAGLGRARCICDKGRLCVLAPHMQLRCVGVFVGGLHVHVAERGCAAMRLTPMCCRCGVVCVHVAADGVAGCGVVSGGDTGGAGRLCGSHTITCVGGCWHMSVEAHECGGAGNAIGRLALSQQPQFPVPCICD